MFKIEYLIIFKSIFINRLMFFFDNEFNVRIEKVFLDGYERKVIVYKGLLLVCVFVVDIVNNKLYWVDFNKWIIEGCDYDGFNRKVIRSIIVDLVLSLFYY